jgi:hypothetical protein
MLLLVTAAAWWWSTRPDDLVTDQPIATVPKQIDEVQPKDDMLATNKEQLATRSEVQTSDFGLRTSDSKPLVNTKRKNKAKTQPQPVLASQIDPETEEAMEEIKAAFQLISAKINKGRKEAAKGLKEIEHMEKGIEKIKENS